jgi:alkylation response protein AidB-like acyl-CoA dehydrogenase
MRFALSPEQEDLRRSARRLLEGSPRARDDAKIWQSAKELGWAQVLDVGWLEAAVLMEEMGRALFSGPFFSSVCLAGAALAELDRPGEAALALHGEARFDGRLSGTKTFVIDGDVTEQLLVVAGDALVLTRGGARKRLETLDPTRHLAEVTFDGDQAELLTRDPAVLARALDRAAVMLAAEQVGGAARCLELATEHAKTREQFGKVIGSFQAVKHKLATMAMDVETARSAALWAAWTCDQRPGEVPAAAAVARVTASLAFLRCAGESIQIHGGIGFTWDHDAHLFFKRARADMSLLGEPDEMRARVARDVLRLA